MINFEPEYFQELNYTKEQIKLYFKNAENDLEKSKKIADANISYRICYDAIIKLGIALIAKHNHKIRSIAGHHFKILEKLGEITKLKEEINFLHYVRRKRNIDLYEGGMNITETETGNLLHLAEKIFAKIKP